MLNIRTLQILVEVARQGGFSRAAQTVHAVQPTVSKAVQAVEDRLGVRRGVDDERPAVSPDDGAVGAQGAERQRHDLHGQNSLLVS